MESGRVLSPVATSRAVDRKARNVLSAFLHHTGTESDKPDRPVDPAWMIS